MTPPNLSSQALRDIFGAVEDIIAHGATPAYAERFAIAAAETADNIARRPLLGHRQALLPSRFRFWAVRGFDYLLVYSTEHPERIVLRVVHIAREMGLLLAELPDASDPEQG